MVSPLEIDVQSKILLVDDTPANLHILSKMLSDRGHKVRAVTDGFLAIKSAQAAPPDLILLDISMPEMDGFETCRRLKSDPATSDIPIIFISAMGQTEDKVRGFEVGGVDYISKPFQVDEVLVRVQNHLTIYNLQQKLQEANQRLLCDVDKLKQMEASEREQRIVAETFREIATTICSNLDLDSVLDMILFEISKLITYDCVNISMIDEHGNAHIERQFGYEKFLTPDQIQSFKLPVTTTPYLQYMVDSGQPYIISDISTRSDWAVQPGKEWVKSYLGAPICIKGIVVGFFNLESRHPGFYQFDQTELMISFASQAGIAIENARLYSDAQRRVEELSILNEISQLISSTTNLAQVTELVYQQVNRLVDAYFFVIAVYNAEKDEWGSLYVRRAGIRLGNFIFKTGEGIGGYVINNRKPLFLSDSNAVDEFLSMTGRESVISKPCSSMMVPLIFSNNVIGVIGVQHDMVENAFTKNDFALFCSIGAQVAIWIENARLFSEMEKLAITDTLTGINNRRQLFILAQQELDRAQRYGHDLSLIIMDIDHFKKVNDDYGHPAGDEVLCALTQLCLQNLRMVDTIGRYGGEEFLILMPETSHQDALDGAGRLLQKIQNMTFCFDNQQTSITASMGIASLGIERKKGQKITLDKLIKRADEALYTAKTTGRNRICD
jgi:diguanylate cyclase (GGDEF)-like protein